MTTCFISIATGVFLVAGIQSARAQGGYQYTRIASTADGLSNFTYTPSLNSQGTAVFAATRSTGTCLFLGSGGPPTPIACENVLGGQIGKDTAAITDDGTVAFLRRYAGAQHEEQDVHLVLGSSIRTLYSTTVQPTYGFYMIFPPSLTRDKFVAFYADTFQMEVYLGVFVGDGGSPITYVRPNRFVASAIGPLPYINNSKIVAYMYRERGTPSYDSINLADGVQITILYSTLGSSVFTSFSDPTLSDSGEAAFYATTTTGKGIFAGNGGPVRTIATTGPDYNDFAPLAAINTSGTVAFEANLTAGGRGIFTGPNPATDKIITTSDQLFGVPVMDVHIGRQAVNAIRQIVFFASLSDGTSGIFRADPVVF